MAKRERIRQEKTEELEEERHQRKRTHAPIHDQLKAPDEGTGTSQVEPSVESHAILLAEANSDEQRAGLVTRLQKSYGNAYVQRVIEHIQSENASGEPLVPRAHSEMEISLIVSKLSSSLVGRQDATRLPTAEEAFPPLPSEELRLPEVFAPRLPAGIPQDILALPFDTPSADVPDLSPRVVEAVKFLIGAGRKQEAIATVINEVLYMFPGLEQCKGKTMRYNPRLTNMGETRWTYNPRTNKATSIEVDIGDLAFASLPELYTTMVHEHEHVLQVLQDPRRTDRRTGLTQFGAYSYEIFHAHGTGLINDVGAMEDLGYRMVDQGWSMMSVTEQEQNQQTYDRAVDIVRNAIADPNFP